jgi:uncharacterized protein
MSRAAAPLKIAIIGSGIAGLSAAWLLSRRHDVTIFEKDRRIGGHVNTVPCTDLPQTCLVDTGFIVYNAPAYPNLTALFEHFDVSTQPADMSLAVSLKGNDLEYSGTNLLGLFARGRNVVSPRFWSMLRDLVRFYREASRDGSSLDPDITLGDYVRRNNYGGAFVDDHLLPMASAIWSAPVASILDYPAQSFIKFQVNHGLLKLAGRPVWRTVRGGAKNYVNALTASFRGSISIGRAAVAVGRYEEGVRVVDGNGEAASFDYAVLATHADQALALQRNPEPSAHQLLSAFRYSNNRAILHSDPTFMPRRHRVWASWNFIGSGDAGDPPTVTYWMNRLQSLPHKRQFFLTLNPPAEPKDILYETEYAHPLFDRLALSAQQRLWEIQGQSRLWYCGSYFGSGFHEDALQSGLAVAEAIDPFCKRPWKVPNESGRIVLRPAHHAEHRAAA